jgi:hypothetical protein
MVAEIGRLSKRYVINYLQVPFSFGLHSRRWVLRRVVTGEMKRQYSPKETAQNAGGPELVPLLSEGPPEPPYSRTTGILTALLKCSTPVSYPVFVTGRTTGEAQSAPQAARAKSRLFGAISTNVPSH